MTRNLWLAAVLIAAVGACVAVSTVAQDDGQGGPGGQGPGGRGGRGQMGGPMMGGGGAAMVALKDHLYVLSGPRLLKIDPEQMKIVAELEISGPGGMGGGMGGPGGQGGPGGRRGPRPGEGEGEEK